MHKRYFYLLILGFVIIGIIFIIPRNPKIKTISKEPPLPGVTAVSPSTPHPKVQRRVINPTTSNSSANKPEDIVTDNLPNEEWQERLEEAILLQAKDSIETVDIKKTESVIFKRDKLNLAAESVVITLTKPDGSQSSFRALVDSETGKILQTWDRPVFDPVHPRENFKVKVPAHYHGN